jgi:hypothetical protein
MHQRAAAQWVRRNTALDRALVTITRSNPIRLESEAVGWWGCAVPVYAVTISNAKQAEEPEFVWLADDATAVKAAVHSIRKIKRYDPCHYEDWKIEIKERKRLLATIRFNDVASAIILRGSIGLNLQQLKASLPA